MPGRRIVIIRHGERMDFTFTDEWIKTCFSDNNTYIRNNLNMPLSVPKRSSPSSFLKDCPLTQIGEFQAILTGKGLVEQKVLKEGFQVFVSPALRCVQTAACLAKGMNLEFEMKIEPDLFEWMAWFREFMPTFMTVEELKEVGFTVDSSYVPVNSINQDEELEELYERSHRLIQQIIQTTDKDLLLVAHGVSLDTLTRQLMGEPIRNLTEMMNLLRGVPYCGSAVIELDEKTNKWNVISIPQLSMKHCSVHDYDATKALGHDSSNDISNQPAMYHQ